jgi:hypothetical protein
MTNSTLKDNHPTNSTKAIERFEKFWEILMNRKIGSGNPHTKADMKNFFSIELTRAREEARGEVIEKLRRKVWNKEPTYNDIIKFILKI